MPGPQVHFRLTAQWAVEEGMLESDSQVVAEADIEVDLLWPGSRKVGRHFNPWATLVFARRYKAEAIRLELAGEHLDALDRGARLERADGTHADDPVDSQPLERPEVGPVIQFAGQDPMPAPVPRQKHHFAAGQRSGQQIVRWRAKRGFNFDPFLSGKPFNMVEAGPADDADAMFRHAGSYSGQGRCARGISKISHLIRADRPTTGDRLHKGDFPLA